MVVAPLYFVSLCVLSGYQDTNVRFAAGTSVVMVVAPLFLVEALLCFAYQIQECGLLLVCGRNGCSTIISRNFLYVLCLSHVCWLL